MYYEILYVKYEEVIDDDGYVEYEIQHLVNEFAIDVTYVLICINERELDWHFKKVVRHEPDGSERDVTTQIRKRGEMLGVRF